ncbi:MAG: carboxypeptidase regulatory-like domain-containing protein [Euryarchaeota archaeon]|nr:carboxypeptidase regulatory-like domain-containing protein [Euryarchaeota archaeon]MDE1836172.1 carboxypeptidase regulatory-like domain-containing protein [Euryarchaeota archaeon]MDE1881027.1 carboxypeptidase regulatory-like domain-containing protein [Euryarchaeota archaeon]MDE2045465.1 carboxypeptidase regulatory-like domain-containing protein [Thermoplasmata archaeon]
MRGATLALSAFVLLLLIVGATAPGTSTRGSPAAQSSPVTVAPPSSLGASPLYTPVFPSPIRHVIIVYLENEEASSVLGTGAYETHLAYHYAYANQYYATTHPSAPNYLSATSGSYFNQSGSDAYNIWKSINIADLVQNAGETWGGFDESMTAPCSVNDSYPYAVKHNPLTYYADIIYNHASRCNPNDLDFNAWNSDVSAGTVPNYAFISPNLLDDGHDTGVSYADNWLSGWLAPLINNTALFSTSVFFITYDEGSSNNGYNGTAGGNVFMTAVSPYSHFGYWSQKQYSHWNLLTTSEWLLGLTGHTYHNDNWTQWPPMKDLFSFPAPGHPPSHYVLQGTVGGTGGSPISGATVSTTLGNTSTTASNGTYRFYLLNGSYTLTASAPGYTSQTQGATVAGASQTLDFNLTASGGPRTYLVSGTVQANYPSTSALAGASVFVNATGGSGSYTATSSGIGTFELNLTNGSYTVVATHPYDASATSTLTISGGPSSATLTLTPRPLSITVSSSVPSIYVGNTGRLTVSATMPSGAPATGAVLSLSSTPLSLPFSPATLLTVPANGTGFVSFVAPTTSSSTLVTVTASVASGSNYPGSGTGTVTVVPSGTVLPATVSGVVFNATSHAVISGASVVVSVQSSGALVQTLTTSTLGAFTASGLAPGTYTFQASDAGYYPAERNVSAAAGSNLPNNDLNLTPQVRGSQGGSPSVTVSANPTSGTAPLSVTFSGAATGGTPPYTFAWSFGDTATSTLQDPTHTYGVGTFTATLSVTDAQGRTGRGSVGVTVTSGSGPTSTPSAGPLSWLTSNPLLLLAVLATVAAVAAFIALAVRRRRSPPNEGMTAWEGAGPVSADPGTATTYAPYPGEPVNPGPPPGRGSFGSYPGQR